MNIGYLGPKGTFSYEVCKDYSNNNDIKEYKSITDTIYALENDLIDEVVVPIENSLQGCVTDTIDTLIEINDDKIKIIKEIIVEINQNLMTKTNKSFDDIEKIYSHPQALSQCKKYLEKNFKNALLIPVESTAQAAKYVAESNENENIACICNMSCKDEYKLNVLDKNIQDNVFNKTKFWVLSKNKSNNDKYSKVSILFSVKDKPGALYSVLKIFNEYKLNLTKIESRPAKTVLGEYIFLIDITIDKTNEDNYKNAIEDIKNNGIYLKNLGIY